MSVHLPLPNVTKTRRFIMASQSYRLLAIAVGFVVGCSGAGGSGDDDRAELPAFPSAGGSTATSTPAMNNPATPASNGQAGASASTGSSGTGNNGQGGSEGNVNVGGVAGGTSAGGGANAGGGAAGAGGGTPVNTPPADPPPPNDDGVTGVGRVGVELCPQGPFRTPLPATPMVSKLFSVGENNFFNFEGPVWVNGALYFSEIGGGNNPPPSRINRFVPGGMFERGVIQNTGSNGLAVDAQGNLIAATHDVGAISTFALPGGARGQVGAQTFNGTRFNSPNDLVQRNDGNVYFTDPTFQAPGNPQGGTRVYRIPPQGAATVVDDTLSNPNGVTLSPDGNTLYVTSASGFRRYAVAADGATSAGTTINLSDALQTPDGMAVDCAGNVYTIEHFRRLIRVFDPTGNELGRFGGPQSFDRDITNMAFGGPNRTTLFVTSLTQGTEGGVFSVELNIPGFPY